MSNKMIGFKGFDKYMQCRGFQYEVGGEYEHEGDVSLCKSGFHFCENPFDVWNYYGPFESRFAEVVAGGVSNETSDDTKRTAKKISIKAELDVKGLVKAAIDFVMQSTKGGDNTNTDNGENYAKIGSSGYYSQIGSSGDYAKIGSSGYYSQIGSSGDYAKIGSSGDSAQIGSSGYSAQIGSSGDYANIGSSGDSAQIGSSGYYAKIGSSGDSAQIGSSGYSAKIGSSGYSAQIGSSGYYAQIGSSG